MSHDHTGSGHVPAAGELLLTGRRIVASSAHAAMPFGLYLYRHGTAEAQLGAELERRLGVNAYPAGAAGTDGTALQLVLVGHAAATAVATSRLAVTNEPTKGACTDAAGRSILTVHTRAVDGLYERCGIGLALWAATVQTASAYGCQSIRTSLDAVLLETMQTQAGQPWTVEGNTREPGQNIQWQVRCDVAAYVSRLRRDAAHLWQVVAVSGALEPAIAGLSGELLVNAGDPAH